MIVCEIEWRPVPGLPGIEVDRDGRFRSFRKRGRPRLDGGVQLSSQPHELRPQWRRWPNGEVKEIVLVLTRHHGPHETKREYSARALVAAAFLGPKPEGYRLVARNHLASDISAGNLMYLPEKRARRYAQPAPPNPTTRVKKVDKAGRVLDVYPSYDAAAAANYMSVYSVKSRVNGHVKSPFRDFDFTFERDE